MQVLILLILFVNLTYADEVDVNGFSIKEFITSNGYPYEHHEIVTEDGYLLSLFRIRHGKNNSGSRSKPPVVLMHGLLGSSEQYLLANKKSLAFMSANMGYDVWLPNARGNMHSRKHKSLDPDSNSTFWDFSLHEIGYYDLPAIIDYILKVSNHSKLHYIGHSQGTTVFFIMASEKPEYLKKVTVFVAMAPSVFLRPRRQALIRLLAPHQATLYKLIDNLGEYEFVPFVKNTTLRKLFKYICERYQYICEILHTLFFGVSSEYDSNLTLNYTRTVPAGASVKQPLHYAQMGNTGLFCQYNHGKKKNMRLYKSKFPPMYKIENVITPTYLFSSWNDIFTPITGVKQLEKMLPNVKEHITVSAQMFNHQDYMMARNIDILVNNKILDILDKYN